VIVSRRLLLSAPWLICLGRAQAQAPSDARVKARLALALARFTQWPATAFAGPTEPLVVCVLSRSEVVAEAFAELSNQTALGRPIKVVQSAERPYTGCHVVFVHESAERNAAMTVTATLAAAAVLTISDAEGFAARGGMVELVNVNDALRLDINLKSVRAASLALSSQVLRLARQVRE
jgi:hypothetical protein